MNKQLVKVCALCDHTIPYHQVVCFAHKVDLEKYENELWFQELVAAQERQYTIDMTEQRGDTFTLQLEQKSTKTRSKLLYNDKKNITKLADKGLGWRKISRILKINGHTVRNFIVNAKKRMVL